MAALATTAHSHAISTLAVKPTQSSGKHQQEDKDIIPHKSAHRCTDNTSFPCDTCESGPHPCIICLSRGPHNMASCCRPTLWNGAPAFVERIPSKPGQSVLQVRLGKMAGALVCFKFNMARKHCGYEKHPEQHMCSGCGATDHGAASCSQAQPASSPNSV
jgi:hypothetical protein